MHYHHSSDMSIAEPSDRMSHKYGMENEVETQELFCLISIVRNQHGVV